MNNIESSKMEKYTPKGKYYQGTGSRKRAISRARLYTGTGRIFLNSKELTMIDLEIIKPLSLVNYDKKFDISIHLSGGGQEARKQAISNSIAKALVRFNKDFKQTLRNAGYITRDSREKERKKPGLKRARRAPQWQKR